MQRKLGIQGEKAACPGGNPASDRPQRAKALPRAPVTLPHEASRDAAPLELLDAAELRPAIIAIAYAAAACAALGTAVFTAYSLRILRKWKQHDD